MRVVLAVAAVIAFLGASAATHGSASGSTETDGRVLLTYVSSDGGLCAMRTDGSHPVRLTPRWHVHSPAWSSDGRFVAFGRGTGPEQSKIAVADARGRLRWMFGEATRNSGPLWSPDTRRIEYVASWAHVGGLDVAFRDGSDDRSIAMSPAFPTYGPANAAWSADSKLIAFQNGNGVELPQGIYTVDLDSGVGGLLVSNAWFPTYSPDGSSLAYLTRDGIVVAGLDGIHPRLLPSSTTTYRPAWSPDSTSIAFIQDQNRALVVARVDGSGQRVIAHNAGPPLWSPGGRLIAFVWAAEQRRHERFRSAIVLARADGSGRRAVVRRSTKTFMEPPAWRAAAPLPKAKRPPCPTN